MQTFFYHGLIRKYVVAFGNMFNTITIQRNENGLPAQSIPVPIIYSDRQKYIKYIENRPNTSPIAVSLPRLSFVMTNITYDTERKLNTTTKLRNVLQVGTGDKKTAISFQATPYQIDFELTAYVKNYDDGAQIVEQIVPYFNPDYTNELILIPELGSQGKYDVRTVLTSVSIQDDTDGSFDDMRTIQWTFNFTMDAFFFGPIHENGLIKRVQVDVVNVPTSGAIEDVDYTSYGRVARIVETPGLTIDGLPTTIYSESKPYLDIHSDDPYGFVNQIFEYDDGKIYDPVTGGDK